MTAVREWLIRLWGSIRGHRRDADLEEELRIHLELAAEDERRRSSSSEGAARAVALQQGGITQAMEALRDQRGLPWLDDLTRDVRHALRSLRHTPVFTAVALLTLALGIGANTAIFSVVNGVILQPLGYRQPAQLMYLTTQIAQLGDGELPVSPPEYMEFREMNRSFSTVGAYTIGEVNLTGDDRPRRVRSAFVDAHLLNALGINTAEGRVFTEGETAPAPQPPSVTILSYELWQAAFGGQSIIGRTVEVDGRRHEVIGIMPPGADVMDNRAEIWLPLGLTPIDRLRRAAHSLSVIGRLDDGATVQSARRELDELIENWSERVGVEPGPGAAGHVFAPMTREGGHTLRMKPVQDEVVGSSGRSIWALQAAVAVVLLIAFANLANLFLARAEARHHEFAVRKALGASRGRLLRQLMTEGLLLSLAGGTLGLMLARVGVQALIRAYPTALPRSSEVTIDALVLLVTLGVSTAAGALFGLAPIMTTGVKGLVMALKEGGAIGSTGAGPHRLRRGLVIAEAALAVVLVAGAGLLVRTVYNLSQVDAGFDPSRLVTFSMTLPQVNYLPSARARMYQRLLGTFRAVPGIEAATAMSGLPPTFPAIGAATDIENYSAPPEAPLEIVYYYQYVTSDYFETMGIPIVAGRGFEEADGASTGLVAVVNETLANTFWNGRNPIGQRLRRCGRCGNNDPWFTVIGVARDVRQGGLAQKTGTEVYVFVEQQISVPAGTFLLAPATMNVMLRTTLPPAALSRTIESVVREADPTVPIVQLRDMDAVFAESIRRPKLLAELSGAFAGLALLLAAIGTYGVLSYMVTERRREIGIRMALGAARSSVLALVMKQGLQLTIVGVAVGVAGALALNRLIASLLFGVQPTDAPTLAAVSATITLVATVACGLPAWRASRLDPSVVLREE